MQKKDTMIATMLVILIVVLFVGGQYKSNREKFTKERWENYEGNSRQTILADFVDRTNVAGLTEAEIEDMLGAPDDAPEGYMVYFLGMPRGLFGTKIEGTDEFLLFYFDDGKVSQLEKVTAENLPLESVYRSGGAALPDDGVFYPGGEGGDAQ